MSFLARRNWLSFMRCSSLMTELQLIVRPLPIVLQNDRGIIGLADFLGPAAGERHPALLQQRGGNRFCQLLLLVGGQKACDFFAFFCSVRFSYTSVIPSAAGADTGPGGAGDGMNILAKTDDKSCFREAHSYIGGIHVYQEFLWQIYSIAVFCASQVAARSALCSSIKSPRALVLLNARAGPSGRYALRSAPWFAMQKSSRILRCALMIQTIKHWTCLLTVL